MRRTLLLAACGTLALGAWSACSEHPASAASSSCETAELKPYGGKLQTGSIPVLFVHGITGSPRIFTEPGLGGARSMAARTAAIPGTSVWTFNYHKVSLDWVTNKQIGPELAKSISCLARQSRKRVVIIAHSMGGLATQYAAAQHDPQGGTEGERIAHVFAIGVPFKGSKLLSVAQDATRDITGGDPATTAVVQALLSECAGIGESAYAHDEENPCGILSDLKSPIGKDLEYDSPAIAALPAWSASIPVTDIAGNIDLTIGVWKLRHTFDVGDLAVSDDSAIAHETSGSPSQIVCHDPLLKLLETSCYHSRLPRNPAVLSAVVPAVRRVVELERATFAPPTYGGVQWRDYVPVRNGRQCVFEDHLRLGSISSAARQTQTTTNARFKPQGVYFVQHAVSVAGAPGIPSTTTTMNLPYLLANNGTLQVTPGLTENPNLRYIYKGFDVYPPLSQLERGKTLKSTVTITLTGATAKVTKALAEAIHGVGRLQVELSFEVKQAPPLSEITTPAGTFRHVVGVAVHLGDVRVPGAPAGTDTAVDKLMSAFLGKQIFTYYAPRTGMVSTHIGGIFASTVELGGCKG